MSGKKAQCRRAPGTCGARGAAASRPFVFGDTQLANGRVALINKGHGCARVRNCKRQVFIISDFLCVLCPLHTTTTMKAKQFLLSHPLTQDGKEDGEEERGRGHGRGRGR